MDVVIRPVNQRFVSEVAFPAFELGARSALAALGLLLEQVDDPECQVDLEALADRASDVPVTDLDADRWSAVVYRLLFSDWRREQGGWRASGVADAFAGSLDETLHLALMIDDRAYPYWDSQAAKEQRERLLEPPYFERGLGAFVAGLWEPFPSFVPGEVLSTRGTRVYKRSEGVAIADWCFRSAEAVAALGAELPHSLGALVEQEARRLRPIELPEANELLAYWTGRKSEPPPLGVAFSGLGTRAGQWVRELGALAAQLRRAAAREQGLTSIITGGQRAWY
jgi:hypothetical protein